MHGSDFVIRISGTDIDFDLFCSAFTNKEVIFTLEVINDGFIHLVTANSHRLGVDNTSKGDHRDFRCSAADVDYHVTTWFSDRQSSSDCSGHRLLDKEDLASAGGF